MSANIDKPLIMAAFGDAEGQRRPPRGLMNHTDRASQYSSREYRTMLEDAGVVISMSRKGNCQDNTPSESEFSTVKTVLEVTAPYLTRDEARDELFKYIVWYNRHRRHTFLQ